MNKERKKKKIVIEIHDLVRELERFSHFDEEEVSYLHKDKQVYKRALEIVCDNLGKCEDSFLREKYNNRDNCCMECRHAVVNIPKRDNSPSFWLKVAAASMKEGTNEQC